MNQTEEQKNYKQGNLNNVNIDRPSTMKFSEKRQEIKNCNLGENEIVSHGISYSTDILYADDPTGIVPLKIEDEVVGQATLRVLRKKALADVAFLPAKKFDDTELQNMYLAPCGNVSQRDEDGNVIAYKITEISIVPVAPNISESLLKQHEQNEAIEAAMKIITQLRKKGWKERRIKRYMLTKHKILLE